MLESARGWAATILFNKELKAQFDAFYARPDTSLGICNGCQLMAQLNFVPWKGIEEAKQPRFIQNKSGRFESRFVNVRVEKSNAIMLQGMEGSTLGVWVAHGEGRCFWPDDAVKEEAMRQNYGDRPPFSVRPSFENHMGTTVPNLGWTPPQIWGRRRPEKLGYPHK